MSGGNVEIREGAGGPSAYVGKTRIRVLNIMRAYELCFEEIVVERICAHYPQLTPEQVRAALEFGREHPEEMDRELAEDLAALARLDENPLGNSPFSG